MKSMIRMTLCLFVLVSACGSAFAARRVSTDEWTPPNAELDRFPHFIGAAKLTLAEIAGMGLMGLQPFILTEAQAFYNFDRIKRRWISETLRPGTQVWKDEKGVVRYKGDCLNRLVAIQPCPPISSQSSSLVPGGGGLSRGTLRSGWSSGSVLQPEVLKADTSPFAGFANSMWDAAKAIWTPTGNLAKGYAGIGALIIGLLLLLLLLALPLLIAYLIYRAIQNRNRQQTAAVATPQNPPPAATIVPATATTVQPAPVMAAAATTLAQPTTQQQVMHAGATAQAVPQHARPVVVPPHPEPQAQTQRPFFTYSPAGEGNKELIRFSESLGKTFTMEKGGDGVISIRIG